MKQEKKKFTATVHDCFRDGGRTFWNYTVTLPTGEKMTGSRAGLKKEVAGYLQTMVQRLNRNGTFGFTLLPNQEA